MRGDEFHRALTSLVDLDEQGTLDLWDAALTNSSPELRSRAWSKYRLLQPKLIRNELVPQIARIRAGAETVQRFANEYRLEVSVWASTGDETVAAVSPRSIERLRAPASARTSSMTQSPNGRRREGKTTSSPGDHTWLPVCRRIPITSAHCGHRSAKPRVRVGSD